MAFGGDSDKLEIKVVVDGKDATISLKELERTIGGLDKPIRVAESGITRLSSAFNVLEKSFNLLSSAFDKADQFDDVASAFDQLTAKANVTAEAFRNDLARATGGLVTNFKLMQQANQALLSGLRPEEYVAVASAAVVMLTTVHPLWCLAGGALAALVLG